MDHRPPAFCRFPPLAAAVLALAFAGRAAAQVPPRAEVVQRVDSMVRAAMATERIPGVSVALVRGTDTLVARGWGLADLENQVPATERTVYRIGSVTKQFTALAILQLAEAGRLSLDDSIQQYVPDLRTPGGRVTLRHLLNHTSGIPSYTSLGTAWQEKMRLDLTPAELLALVQAPPPDFAPGERFLYDNTGYYLLGLVIERASGEPYARYLQEHVFTPLGLSDTRYCGTREIIPRRAQGYRSDSTGIVNADYISMAMPYAAGALCSTILDLLAWQRALSTDRLLPPGGYASMSTSGRLNSGAATGYGFGLSAGTIDGHRHIGHSGGINGFGAMLDAWPDDSLVVVVLANSEGANTQRLARNIARAALGLAVPVVRDLPLTAADRARYEGTYQLPGLALRVFSLGDTLMVQAEGQGAFRLLAQGGNVFVPSFDGELRLEFEMADGRARAFTLHQGGAVRRAARTN